MSRHPELPDPLEALVELVTLQPSLGDRPGARYAQLSPHGYAKPSAKGTRLQFET